jgi:lipoate-protein ligase A
MYHEDPDEELTPEAHLQRERQMYQQVEAGADACLFRTWESARPVVVLGRNAPAGEHVILEACRADDVPILSRFTGGGSVVLGPGCLNYAIALPVVSRPELGDVGESFRIILGWIAATLGVRGLAIAGGTDLVLNGLKVSGNAQRRGRRALIHHGTLLYDFDRRLATRYLREPRRQPIYRDFRRHAEFIGNLPLRGDVLRMRLRGLTVREGITIASRRCMADEPTDATRGAQEVTTGEREARKQAERQQDLQQPPEGRDIPPEDEVKRGNRTPDSPWMGGG